MSDLHDEGAEIDAENTMLREENRSLRRLLHEVALLVESERDLGIRCVEVARLVGPPDGWVSDADAAG